MLIGINFHFSCGSNSNYTGASFLGAGISTGNLIVGVFSMPYLTSNGVRIHQENHMASVLNHRPFLVVDGQESDPNMRILFDLTEKDIKDLQKESIKIPYGDKELEVFANVTLTKLDGKAVRMAQGRPAAYCVCCDVTRIEAHEVDRIKAGFLINLSTEEIVKRYEDLKKYEESKKSKNFQRNAQFEEENEDEVDRLDYQVETLDIRLDTRILPANMRRGAMTKPMVEKIEVTRTLSPLHCRLRIFTWVTTIMMRLDAGKTKYREHINDVMKKEFARVERGYKERSQTVLHRPMFLPRQGSGTSDTGKKEP